MSSEPRIRSFLRQGTNLLRDLRALRDLGPLQQRAEYLDREGSRLQAAMRRQQWIAGRQSTLPDIMTDLGFTGMARTLVAWNHHLRAERLPTA